jgi:hypothetical protein
MELSPSLESASYSVTQEFPKNAWNPNFQYCVHKSPTLNNSVLTVPSYLLSSILILSFLQHVCLPRGLFPSGFTTKDLSALLSSPCVLHALQISSSMTWSLLLYLAKSECYEAPHYVIISTCILFYPSLLQIFSSTLFSNAISLNSSLKIRDKVSHS